MNKLRNVKTPCNQGHMHQSGKEAAHCNMLWLQLKAGEIKGYKVEEKFDLHSLMGKKVCFHRVDFLVTNNDDSECVHEIKGRKKPTRKGAKYHRGSETAVWRLKKKMFEAEYPEIEYIVFRY